MLFGYWVQIPWARTLTVVALLSLEQYPPKWRGRLQANKRKPLSVKKVSLKTIIPKDGEMFTPLLVLISPEGVSRCALNVLEVRTLLF
jgi:hypothetical protein